MTRTVALSAIVLAAAAFLLEQLEYRFVLKTLPAEGYIALVAIGFAALGVYAGRRLAGPAPTGAFARNDAAIRELRISTREIEILEKVAAGGSNKEIARDLAVSPHTVKTHVSNLYQKLEVRRRTEAVDKARRLGMIA
ncbi:MAG: LuxR C-terminal-related transcriptional regulator [Pseudomonadota bacterium]